MEWWSAVRLGEERNLLSSYCLKNGAGGGAAGVGDPFFQNAEELKCRITFFSIPSETDCVHSQK